MVCNEEIASVFAEIFVAFAEIAEVLLATLVERVLIELVCDSITAESSSSVLFVSFSELVKVAISVSCFSVFPSKAVIFV